MKTKQIIYSQFTRRDGLSLRIVSDVPSVGSRYRITAKNKNGIEVHVLGCESWPEAHRLWSELLAAESPTEDYKHGSEFGQQNAIIYGASHAARHDYQHDTDFCCGYRDGYENELLNRGRQAVGQSHRKR